MGCEKNYDPVRLAQVAGTDDDAFSVEVSSSRWRHSGVITPSFQGAA
jgi:hypothetical protein